MPTQRADLREANFKKADLDETDLRYANLQEVCNLTIYQLAKARTLYGAKLDKGLLKEVRLKYRHLLGKTTTQPGAKKKFK